MPNESNKFERLIAGGIGLLTEKYDKAREIYISSLANPDMVLAGADLRLAMQGLGVALLLVADCLNETQKMIDRAEQN